jgi:cholest-4-en-3-one 26-monooxygenase
MPGADLDLRVLDVDSYANGDPATFGLPLDQYAYLQEHEPCYRLEFHDPAFIDRAWVISRHADILEVDRNAELYAADRGFVNMYRMTLIDPRAGGMPSMLTMDGADHQRSRGLISRDFTSSSVRRLAGRLREYAAAIVDAAVRKGTFDFVQDIAHTMPVQALGDLLGVPEPDRGTFFGWVDTFAAPAFDSRLRRSRAECMEAADSLMIYVSRFADARGREPGGDVLSTIARAGDIMSAEEIMGNVAVLAAGAAESTRTALGHGMHELMRDRVQMAWLRARAQDIPASAVQEILRIAAPFTHLVRTATADHELHGQQVKAGDLVLMLFAAGNFDPRAFGQPRRFDLARDPNRHLSFGYGPHLCLGRHVAALEIKILLEELLRRTTDIRPAGDVSYVRDAYSRRVYELPVTVVAA